MKNATSLDNVYIYIANLLKEIKRNIRTSRTYMYLAYKFYSFFLLCKRGGEINTT